MEMIAHGLLIGTAVGFGMVACMVVMCVSVVLAAFVVDLVSRD